MRTLQYQSEFEVYETAEALPEDLQLLEKAREAMEVAYAPYSRFQVGAAVRLADGSVIIGSNQENASYPQGLCAERVALFAAGAQSPEQAPVAIALCTSELQDVPVSPCGGCRQVMVESEQRYAQPMRLIMTNSKGEILVMKSVSGLLPWAFDGRILLDS